MPPMRCHSPMVSILSQALRRAHKPDVPSLDDARDRAVTNALRPMSAIVIQCSRGWQPAHQGVIPGQVGHPFLIRRKLADRGRNAWVRTVMSDQSLAATVGLKGGLIPRGASAPGDRPVARHRCGYRVILRESPLFLTRIIFKVPRRPLILIIGPAGVSWQVLSGTSRF